MRSAASPSLDCGCPDSRGGDRRPSVAERPPSDALPVAQPRRRTPRAFRLPCLRTAIASTLIIGILVAFAGEDHAAQGHRAVPVPVPVAPAAAWRPLAGTAPPYALEGSRFSARIHPEHGREDTLSLGAFGEAAPHLRLVLRRGPPPAPSSLFVDLARRAGSVGLSVSRSARSATVPTKFGPVEVAEATLSGEGERACIAFRFEHRESGFGLAGWLCGTPERPARATVLACLLDHLTLTADDPALRGLFAPAERRRPEPCEPPGAVAESAPERIPAELFRASARPPTR